MRKSFRKIHKDLLLRLHCHSVQFIVSMMYRYLYMRSYLTVSALCVCVRVSKRDQHQQAIKETELISD